MHGGVGLVEVRRNVFIAPWLRGAAALLHDARFDPAERLEVAEREGVNVLCMAPTEYRVIGNRAQLRPIASLRGLVAAGEALDPEVLGAWHDATGVWIRDGYGQTETGQLTGNPPAPNPAGVDGQAAARGVAARRRRRARPRPRDGPDVLPRLPRRAPHGGPWRTGDLVRADEDGYLYFKGRTDDVIVSAGYRIGPFEVESALVAHPAVADAAAVAAPDRERGPSCARSSCSRTARPARRARRASCRTTSRPRRRRTSTRAHRRVADELPRTNSGKVRRALLRET